MYRYRLISVSEIKSWILSVIGKKVEKVLFLFLSFVAMQKSRPLKQGKKITVFDVDVGQVSKFKEIHPIAVSIQPPSLAELVRFQLHAL